ncbi:MAG: hypothetical protein J1F16_01010 [Muribaculaceae bacterium]|nr:hypothetical protein [Muribaculaceae bacterium]
MKGSFKKLTERINIFLKRFSFKTGVIILSLCIPFYILSFAQMALDISYSLKGVLWVIFFGLAKTFQYAGLAILGVEGIKRLKKWWYNTRNKNISEV